ncbi:DMT family transporter [Candidatus Woesearchaeota archaeon]|nr:DMT family transporter [Candidatus Woesearchaeota archaeon]
MLSTGITTGLIAMFCWGIADFIQAIPLKKIGSIKTILIRSSLIFLFTFPLGIFLYFKGIIDISLSGFFLIILTSLIFVFASYTLVRGFEIGELSLVSPISSSFTIITVLLAVVFLKESLSSLKLLSIFIIIIGIILTSTDIKKVMHVHKTKGIKEALISMLLYGIYFFILGFISKSVDALNMYLFTSVFQSFFFILFCTFKKDKKSKFSIAKKHIFLLVLNTILLTAAWAVFNYGLSKSLTSIVTSISSLYPAVTVILAVIFFKEKLVLNQKFGILLILVGLFLISI